MELRILAGWPWYRCKRWPVDRPVTVEVAPEGSSSQAFVQEAPDPDGEEAEARETVLRFRINVKTHEQARSWHAENAADLAQVLTGWSIEIWDGFPVGCFTQNARSAISRIRLSAARTARALDGGDR